MARRSNGLPGGHAHLGHGLPGLKKDSLEGVLSVEVLAAPFRPEVVEEEAPKNVERLASVREAARVVTLEVRGVVFLFEDGFSEKDERPSDGEAVGRLPLLLGATEGLPGLLGRGANHKAVLGGLKESMVATFASVLEPHGLEPRAHREPFVEGQPDKGPHFAWAGVVPYPGHNLHGRGVSEV
jgi:hypothetical protein